MTEVNENINTGFIKIYRSILKSSIFQDADIFKTYMYILLRASYIDKEMIFNKSVVNIKRGQFITGRKMLSKDLNLSERKIRTTLKILQKMQKIDQQTTSKYSIITVCNYDSYNNSDLQSDQQSDHQTTIKRPSNDQQTTTIKKEYKEKKEKKEYVIDTEISKIIDYYNQNRGNCLPVSTVTDTRINLVSTLLDIYDEEMIMSGIDKIKNSRYLQGKLDDQANRPSSFDFIFRSDTFVKLLEGTYDEKQRIKKLAM